MDIRYIKIRNFRGIKELDWVIDNRVTCLIGPGDSTKTTILDAIEYTLYPNWNLQFTDSDFYNGDISQQIIIETSFENIPIALLSEDKFGMFLRKITDNADDEPNENEPLLTIRLTVGESLEPEWKVVNNRSEGKPINNRDRALMNVKRIGGAYDRDFAWGRGSILYQIAEQKAELSSSIVGIIRDAKEKFSLDEATERSISDRFQTAAKEFGVITRNQYRTSIDMRTFSANSTSFSIFDDSIPLRNYGTGTRRLLSMGLNIGNFDGGVLLLVDEIEFGLEPYRIRSFLKKLYSLTEKLQVIFTSHSPTTMVELDAENLYVVRSSEGVTKCRKVSAELQSTIRAVPEAILSKRVIVCEGKTEYGIIKAMDCYWMEHKEDCGAYHGVSYIEGGGGDATNRATALNSLGYSVLLFVDADVKSKDKILEGLERDGVKVVKWKDGLCTEQQLFNDIPLPTIPDLIKIAFIKAGVESVLDSINDKFGLRLDSHTIDSIIDLADEDALRKGLASIAIKKQWYKRVDMGQEIGELITTQFHVITKSDLYIKLHEIETWVYE